MAKLENLKVGMRVAVYNLHGRMLGEVHEIQKIEGTVGIKHSQDRPLYWAHPKQIRILKPKRKPIYFWLDTTSMEALNCPPSRVLPGEAWVTVREVLPKKKTHKNSWELEPGCMSCSQLEHRCSLHDEYSSK